MRSRIALALTQGNIQSKHSCKSVYFCVSLFVFLITLSRERIVNSSASNIQFSPDADPAWAISFIFVLFFTPYVANTDLADILIANLVYPLWVCANHLSSLIPVALLLFHCVFVVNSAPLASRF